MKAIQTKTTSPAHNQQKSSQPFFKKAGGESLMPKSEPFFSPRLQTKLSIGQPNDQYEQEADNMADKVVQRLATPDISKKTEPIVQAKTISNFSLISTTRSQNIVQNKCAECEKEEKLQKKENGEAQPELQLKPIFESGASDDDTPVQRKCATCGHKEEKLQKKSDDSSVETASSSIESSLSASKGSGSPLPENTRNAMESSFGSDFSNVRIHTGSNAVQMSQDLNAQAFTHGNDIYFNAGKYDDSSNSGKNLLAHELTHTVQQVGIRRKSIELIQRWSIFDDRTNRKKIDDALNSKDSGDVKDITNFGEASEKERVDLIRIILKDRWVGPTLEGVLEDIWKSFANLPKIANENITLFKSCLDRGAELDDLSEVKNLRKVFANDVKFLAKQYLKLNTTYTKEELQSLGLSQSDKPGEEDRLKAMEEIKVAAGLVKKAQEGQNRLKATRIIGGDWIVAWGSMSGGSSYIPAHFNPEKPPDSTRKEDGDENLQTWEGTKKQYDRFTDCILGLSNRYPSIYALVRDEKIAEFTDSDSSKAVSMVNDSLNNVLNYINITNGKIDENEISFYDLVPIHGQLFDGSKQGQSQTKWNEEFYKWTAESDISAHESKEFWITIGLSTLAAAAFVVAELATFGTATFAIAAGIGVGIGVGQAAYSWQRYRDLAAASKSNVSDETSLVSQGQASVALVEAIINTAFVFVDLYAPVAKGLKAGTKIGEEVVETAIKSEAKNLGKASLEDAEKALSEKSAKEVAEKQAAEKLAEDLGKGAGKSISRRVLDFMKEILKEFTESVKTWAKKLFNKFGFKAYEVIDEGEYLVLYGIRSRVRLAQIRKSSSEKMLVDKDTDLAEKIASRNTKLAESRLAKQEGDTLLANASRQETIVCTEKIGEEVAMKEIKKKFGESAILMHRGSGSGTLDLIYKLPSGEFIVVEAKGGAGKLGFRNIGGGVKAQQGTTSYLRSVLKKMTTGKKAALANELMKAQNQNKIKYLFSKTPISTDPEALLETTLGEFVLR